MKIFFRLNLLMVADLLICLLFFHLRHIVGFIKVLKYIQMLGPYQIPAYLMMELPEIVGEFKYIYPSVSIFKTIRCFADYTMWKVLDREVKGTKKCFMVAGVLYAEGSQAVRFAMDRIFFPSLFSLISRCNTSEKSEVLLCMPLDLRLSYSRYIRHSAF